MELNYTSKIIVDFDSIVDTDFGIICYVIKHYKDSKYLLDYVVKGTEYFVKCLLLVREDENPLSIIFKPEYKNSIDSILKEIETTDEYKEVLKHAKPTAIFGLIETYKKTNGVIDATILCKNQIQEQYIKKIDNNLKVIVSESIDLEPYGTMIVKNYSSLLRHNNVLGKSIIVCEYAYNMDKDRDRVLNPKVDVLISKSNNTFIVFPYLNFKLPEKVVEREVEK